MTRLKTLSMLLIVMATSAPVRAGEEIRSDFFSTPDTQKAPGFMGRKSPDQLPDPLYGPGGDPPGRDALRSIPSMSGKQLGEVDHTVFSNRDEITPLQEEVNSLKRILDQRKNQKFPLAVQMSGAPVTGGGNMMMMDSADTSSAPNVAYSGESDEAIKERIDMLNHQISAIRDRLWPSLRSILTADQLRQLQSMRSGNLVVVSNASTDLPEPLPPAPHGPVAPKESSSRPFSEQKIHAKKIVNPIIYTTKQMIYRNLWRL